MINTLSLSRPGLTAIAAVLALSSTSAIAQVALPEVAAPEAPSMAVPVAAPAASAPIVQSVPATPALPDIAVTEAPTEAAPARPRALQRERVEAAAQPAERQVTQRQTAVEKSVTPAATSAVPTMSAAPTMQAERPKASTVPVSEPLASEQSIAPQSPAKADASDDMGYAGWVLLGGGLLIVAGGAAFAMSRRPKRGEENVTYAVPASSSMPQAAALHPSPPVDREPLTPAANFAAIAATPATRRQSQPIGGAAHDDHRALLEAMVAEAPSEANPFHSRRNRLRRADYLLRTGQAQPHGNATAHASNDQAMATDRWSEMRFGGKQSSRISWKPATTR